MTISAPQFNSLSCISFPTPPYIFTAFIPVSNNNFLASIKICSANSRVGTIIIDTGAETLVFKPINIIF